MWTVLVFADPLFNGREGDVAGQLDVNVTVLLTCLGTYFQAPRDIRDFGLICDLLVIPSFPLIELSLEIVDVETRKQPVIGCCSGHDGIRDTRSYPLVVQGDMTRTRVGGRAHNYLMIFPGKLLYIRKIYMKF